MCIFYELPSLELFQYFLLKDWIFLNFFLDHCIDFVIVFIGSPSANFISTICLIFWGILLTLLTLLISHIFIMTQYLLCSPYIYKIYILQFCTQYDQIMNDSQHSLTACTHIKYLTKKTLQQLKQLKKFNTLCISCDKKLLKQQNKIILRMCLHCGTLICDDDRCMDQHYIMNKNGHIFMGKLSQQQQQGIVCCLMCNRWLTKFSDQLQQGQNRTQQEMELIKAKNQINRFLQFLHANVIVDLKKAVREYALSYHASSSQQIIQNYQPYGLENLGNTCYINVVIQALNHIRPLRQYYLQQQWGKMHSNLPKIKPSKEQQYFYDQVLEDDEENRWHVVTKNQSKNKNQYKNSYGFCSQYAVKDTRFNQQLGHLLQLLQPNQLNQYDSIEPVNFYQQLGHLCPKYTEPREQDAQELLYFVLDCLAQGQTLKISNKERYEKIEKVLGRQKLTLTHKIFASYFVSCIKCEKCLKQSWKLDLTYGLSVPLPEKTKQFIIKKQQKPQKQNNSPIDKIKYYKNLYYPNIVDHRCQLVQPLFKEQRLTYANNYWACEACEGASANKKLYLLEEPEVLIISIKRFTHTHRNAKINDFVPFEETMDLSSICLRNQEELDSAKAKAKKYKLQAIIVHEGSQINTGHYICYLRHTKYTWYRCSDHKVSKVTWKQVKKLQAYILIYKKKRNYDIQSTI